MMKNNKLSGISSLAYQGTGASSPPNMRTFSRAPTQNDYLNFSLGDFWIHRKSSSTNDSDLYVLMGVAQGVADWDLISANSGAVTQFTTDDASTVIPSNGNVNLAGAHGLNTTGSGATATFQIDNSLTLGDLTPIGSGDDALDCETGDVEIQAGNLKIPRTIPTSSSPTQGMILKDVGAGYERFMHSLGTNNTFLGNLAGPSSLTTPATFGTQNTGVGTGVLRNLTGAAGGQNNAAMGVGSLRVLTTGSSNAAYGGSLGNLTTGNDNIAVGLFAGSATNYTAGITTGHRNILIGKNSGLNYTSDESDNIMIGYNTGGAAGEDNTLRIGNGTGTGNGNINRCFISGIRGITTGVADAVAVLVDSANQLGTVSSSERYKQDIRSLGEASDIIYKLQPRFFHYKKHPEVPAWGLIAEEVDKVFPQLCVYDEEGHPDSVKYHDLPVLLLNEIKKLNKRIEELEDRVCCGGSKD